MEGSCETGGWLVSVIVPAKNAEATLVEQLEALAAQTFSGAWEVLVADNGSTDRTMQIAQSFADRLPDLRVIDASSTAGSAHARNVAARHANGEVLCFCDADDVVRPRWLEALVECAGDADLVGGRLDIEALNDRAARSWRPTPQAARDVVEMSFAPSSNMAIRRKVFLELGGFDETYMKSHDVEFSHRARVGGLSIGFCPGAVVEYRLRADLRGLAKQAYRAGRAQAQSYADGYQPERPLTVSLRDWIWLVVRIPTTVTRRRRGIWVRRASEAAGRCSGSLRWRVRYL